ncbi:hypothetical protein P8605_34665 [Streptomyces sp. T-3]|nr:hypothetical protein [Streptomyces sp. T-3]
MTSVAIAAVLSQGVVMLLMAVVLALVALRAYSPRHRATQGRVPGQFAEQGPRDAFEPETPSRRPVQPASAY